jgi:hypothetical protein
VQAVDDLGYAEGILEGRGWFQLFIALGGETWIERRLWPPFSDPPPPSEAELR